MAKTKSLTFKNNQIVSLNSLLRGVKLKGKDARVRNRFFKIITPRLQEVEEERKKIGVEHSKKDKDGNVKTLDVEVEGKKQEGFDFKKGEFKKFKKEYNEVLKEDFIVDILPSNKDDLIAMGVILENLDVEFTVETGAVYDAICEIFDTL